MARKESQKVSVLRERLDEKYKEIHELYLNITNLRDRITRLKGVIQVLFKEFALSW